MQTDLCGIWWRITIQRRDAFQLCVFILLAASVKVKE